MPELLERPLLVHVSPDEVYHTYPDCHRGRGETGERRRTLEELAGLEQCYACAGALGAAAETWKASEEAGYAPCLLEVRRAGEIVAVELLGEVIAQHPSWQVGEGSSAPKVVLCSERVARWAEAYSSRRESLDTGRYHHRGPADAELCRLAAAVWEAAGKRHPDLKRSLEHVLPGAAHLRKQREAVREVALQLWAENAAAGGDLALGEAVALAESILGTDT